MQPSWFGRNNLILLLEKNVIIIDPRKEEKILTYKVVPGKSIDGRENIKIIIKSPELGGIGGAKTPVDKQKKKRMSSLLLDRESRLSRFQTLARPTLTLLSSQNLLGQVNR